LKPMEPAVGRIVQRMEQRQTFAAAQKKGSDPFSGVVSAEKGSDPLFAEGSR
jgi:hypothetical protein